MRVLTSTRRGSTHYPGTSQLDRTSGARGTQTLSSNRERLELAFSGLAQPRIGMSSRPSAGRFRETTMASSVNVNNAADSVIEPDSEPMEDVEPAGDEWYTRGAANSTIYQ